MKLTITALALALAVLAGPAFAASHAASAPMADKKPTAQQGKMAACNKDAADKKGEERKAFMKTCLSAKAKADASTGTGTGTPQQSKMKTCNTSAGEKKGDERKAFMKECLSKKA